MTEQQHETFSRDEIRRALGSAMDPLTGREVCDVLGCETRKERDGVYKALSLMSGHKAGIEQLGDGRYTLIPGWKDSRPAAGKATSETMRARRGRQDPMLGHATTDRQVNAERAPAPVILDTSRLGPADLEALRADNGVGEVVVIDSLSGMADVPYRSARADLADQAEVAGLAESAAQIRAIAPTPAAAAEPDPTCGVERLRQSLQARARERAEHTPARHHERLQARRHDEIGIPRATLRTLVAALLEHAGELTERQRQAAIDATRLAA